jgi:hypothetical protein
MVSIKMIDLILPHVQEDTRRYIIDGLPNVLDSRKRIFPDRLPRLSQQAAWRQR